MKNIVKSGLFLIAMFLPLLTANAQSRQEALRLCRNFMNDNPAEVIVYYNYGNLAYNTTESKEALEKLYEKISNQKVLGKAKVRGLTRLRPYALMRTEIKQKAVDSQRICSVPAKIEITIGYDRPTIYLANSLKKGSCRYKLTLRHELTHLDIGHSALYFLGQALKNEMPKIIAQIGPKLVSSNNQNTAQKLNDLYQNQISSIMDIYKNTLIQEQSKLDTLENYNKESSLCAD